MLFSILERERRSSRSAGPIVFIYKYVCINTLICHRESNWETCRRLHSYRPVVGAKKKKKNTGERICNSIHSFLSECVSFGLIIFLEIHLLYALMSRPCDVYYSVRNE